MKTALRLISLISLASTSLTLADSAVEKYKLNWMIDDSQSSEFVKTRIEIHAPTETIWQVIKAPERYSDWTTRIIAKAPRIQPGEPIELWIDLMGCCGKTYSSESIRVVDEDTHAIAWGKSLGFGLSSEMWQVLIPSPDQHSTLYYSGIKIPNPFGSTLNFFGTMKKLKLFLDGFSKALKEKSEYGLLREQELQIAEPIDREIER